MSRISFFLDMVFKKLGLSGKTLIPFIVGSGCSVPGIMATRTIENKSEREMSIILTPFIPCSAKLPIIALFAGMFFPSSSGLISASLYFMSILIILILTLMLKKFIYKEENSTFISELPEYKLPSFKYVFKDVFDKVLSFIKRAGSVILVSSIILWFLLSFSFKFEYGVDVENSMLASIGKLFSWVFYPILGEFSWAATVSAIQGLVAKEQVVGSMAVIANVSEEGNMIFNSGVFSFFNAASAYAFVVFNLFSAPCFGAIGAMKKELGSTKKMMYAILLQTGLAWIIAVLVNLIGNLFI
jgi:ferrous iron transport protein B